MNKLVQIIFLFSFFAIIGFFAWIWVSYIDKGEATDFKKEAGTDFVTEKDLLGNNSTDSSINSNLAQNQETNTPVSMTPEQLEEYKQYLASKQAQEINLSEPKIFTGQNNSFSVSLPEGASASESLDVITISQNGKTWKIKFFSNNNKKSLSDWLIGKYDGAENNGCMVESSTIKIASYETKLLKSGSSSKKCEAGGSYAISSDSARIIKIEKNQETEDNINAILSSFKFL